MLRTKYRIASHRKNSILFSLLCVFFFSASNPANAAGLTEKLGDVLSIAIPATAFGATFYLDDGEGRMQFYKSFLTTSGATQGLKYFIDKERPNGGKHSFPSGHTSSAFQGAAFIFQRYGWEYGTPAYIAATFVGYSRVQAKKHYTIDVVAGATIGIASNMYFTQPYKGFKITPVTGRGFYGITASTSW